MSWSLTSLAKSGGNSHFLMPLLQAVGFHFILVNLDIFFLEMGGGTLALKTVELRPSEQKDIFHVLVFEKKIMT